MAAYQAQLYASDSSSDEEIIQPMKLSQYTNAILNGEVNGSSPLNALNRRTVSGLRSKRASSGSRHRPSVAFKTPSPSQTQDSTPESETTVKHVVRINSPCPADSKYAISYASSPSSQHAKTAEIRASEYITAKLSDPRPKSAPTSTIKSIDNSPVALVSSQDTVTTASSLAPSQAQDLYDTVVNGSQTESAAACKVIADKTEAAHRRRRIIARPKSTIIGSIAPARRGLRAELDMPDDLPAETEPETSPGSNVMHILDQPNGKLQVYEDEPPASRSSRPGWLTQPAPPTSSTARPTSSLKIASSIAAAHTFKRPDLSPLIEINNSPAHQPPTSSRRTPLTVKSTSASNVLHSAVKPLSLADLKTQTPHKPSPIKATPLRPAPPPPTSQHKSSTHAVASTKPVSTAQPATSSKKRGTISLNSKTYQRLDLLGRGGSARVYRVMSTAGDYGMYALKRVALTDCSERALSSFRQEIDLLQKLAHEDRVIKLTDFEIAPEKGSLSVLMELGECDFNVLLARKLAAPAADAAPTTTSNTTSSTLAEQAAAAGPKLDVNFVRYYWKELLECIATIQRHSIVHSDLKPANFVLCAGGKLKLIDFGIASEIGDETVNVHRSNHVGTPNYMSPESLIDINEDLGGEEQATRLMKLGKPSDVWSLACMLYQMVYGKAPFAHIQGQMSKMRAITSESYRIAFPSTGLGDVPLPPGLVFTLKRCLRREPSLRPTVEQLLSADDVFLYPSGEEKKRGTAEQGRTPGTVEISVEGLASVLNSAFRYCSKNGVPADGDMPVLAKAIYEKLRKSSYTGVGVGAG